MELPVVVDGEGIHPQKVPPLPEPCASLCRRNVEVQAEVANAVLTENPRCVFNAVMLDPLASACLDLKGLRELFEDMVNCSRDVLPDWLVKGVTAIGKSPRPRLPQQRAT